MPIRIAVGTEKSFDLVGKPQKIALQDHKIAYTNYSNETQEFPKIQTQ